MIYVVPGSNVQKDPFAPTSRALQTRNIHPLLYGVVCQRSLEKAPALDLAAWLDLVILDDRILVA
jgi:hypothetical protein